MDYHWDSLWIVCGYRWVDMTWSPSHGPSAAEKPLEVLQPQPGRPGGAAESPRAGGRYGSPWRDRWAQHGSSWKMLRNPEWFTGMGFIFLRQMWIRGWDIWGCDLQSQDIYIYISYIIIIYIYLSYMIHMLSYICRAFGGHKDLRQRCINPMGSSWPVQHGASIRMRSCNAWSGRDCPGDNRGKGIPKMCGT